MKRNWDVIREVLITVEGLDTRSSEEYHYDVSEDDANRVAEHAVLLWKAGYLEGADASSVDGPYLIATGLTWGGHELLETMRSKPVWENIKTIAQQQGVELTFEAVKTIASMAWKATLGGG